MSYPFLALALAIAACHRSLSRYSARAGNSYPDCRLDLGQSLPTSSFPILRFYNKSQLLSSPTSPLPHPNANPDRSLDQSLDSPLTIAGRTFQSRLMTGTGNIAPWKMQQALPTAVANCHRPCAGYRQGTGHEGLAEALDWTKLWMLPNTAGCQTAEEAIRVARLGREMAKLLGQEDNNFVKLEVIPDLKYLLPDPIGTLEAAEQLVKEGFAVLLH